MREAIADRPWISLRTMADASDLSRAFAELGAHGTHRVSCIGGRTLASHLLERQLVDDVFLTTSPRPGGKPGTPISETPWRGRVLLRKNGTGAEAGVVVEHLLPRRV
jgi:riboflavin biosynthesis pyrimidine reductase